MGTRHIITVKLNDEVKVRQYGQWDGYPTGQGKDIADFIHNEMDYDKLCINLQKVHFLSDEEIEKTDLLHPHGSWVKKLPWLSRDCGAKILKFIQDSKEGLGLIEETEVSFNSSMIRYAYDIDMTAKTVTINESITKPFDEWTAESMNKLEKTFSGQKRV